MKTLHTAYRVTDLAVALAFYGALGYESGRPGRPRRGREPHDAQAPDDEFVSLE